MRLLLLVILGVTTLLGQIPRSEPTTNWLPMRFANLPACPVAKGAAVHAEMDGSTLLMRVQDPTGVALEVWCGREAAGFNYQYRVRSSDGKSRAVDRCTWGDGISSVGVDHEGEVVEAPLENGGQWLKIRGRLGHFFQDNWNARAGHHTLFDFAHQTLDVSRTSAIEDGLGRSIRVMESTETFTLAELPAGDSRAALGKLPPERVFEPGRTNCLQALADEGMRLRTEEVDAFLEPGKLGKARITWPESVSIAGIRFDPAKRELHVTFPPGARKTTISLSFPRKLVGIGKEIAKVRLDGQFVPTDETITATHRTVRFRLDNPAKEALITESGGFPFFMVSGLAIGGGVVIGLVLALLFRRKLPAVADDETDLPANR